jgi:NAD(P)-dependent dehydrogenase (short-subunit alcohol dehydrogenase family)
MTHLGRLAGKVAVVTGASRGIGKQTSLELAAMDASVVLVARTKSPREATPGTLLETAELIDRQGGRALVVPTDLAKQDEIDSLVRTTLDEVGGVDFLINNAAYTVGKALWTHKPHLSREQWEKGFAINVTDPLMLIEGFWRSMVERGGGVVVNVTSSAASLQPLDRGATPRGVSGLDSGPIYGATKASLNRTQRDRA